MDGDQIIIGLDQKPVADPRPGGPDRWPVIVVAVAAALALGVLIGNGQGAVEPTSAEIEQVAQVEAVRDRVNLVSDLPEVREPEPAREPRPIGLPLRELVPSFPDSLIVTLLDADDEPFYQLVWGPGASSAGRVTTLDDGVFDRSGNFFARIEHSLWNGQMLAVGDLSSRSTGPMAVGADAYVWHGSDGGRIAWTGEVEDGRRALFTGDLERIVGDGVAAVSYVTDIGGARLVAWDDWGFALESDGELILLGTNGSDLGRRAVRFLGSASRSTIAVADGSTVLVGEPDLATLVEPWWADRLSGEVVAVQASPTRSVLAVEVIESAGPVTYVVEEDDIVRLALDGSHPQRWSSDGRFLIFSSAGSGPSVLTFYDLDTDQTFLLEMSDKVDRVFVRPG